MKPPKKRPFFAAILCLAAIAAVATFWLLRKEKRPDTSLQTTTAVRAEAPVAIDGRLDDPVWQRAEVAGPFIISNGSAHAPLAATARLAWDETALYVAFEVEDEDLTSPLQERDSDLWAHDVVEVFLDPGGDGLNYYEFQVSPHGVIFDALFPSYRKNLARSRRWNARGIRAAVAVDGFVDDDVEDVGWTVELLIPFAAIKHAPRSPPKAGDQWRMNLFRIDMHGDGQGHYTAWTAPIKGDFHTLDRFGTLVFGD